MSPSSTNIQPWNFVLAKTQEGKDLIAKSTENYGFNTQNILDAAAVVFGASTEMTDEHLNLVLETEEKDGRFPLPEHKEGTDQGRRFFLQKHQYDLKDDKHWMEKQVYLNVGHLAFATAALGIESTIMEGFDAQILDEQLKFREKGFTSVVIMTLGYHEENEDYNEKLPKSRLAEDKVIKEL